MHTTGNFVLEAEYLMVKSHKFLLFGLQQLLFNKMKELNLLNKFYCIAVIRLTIIHFGSKNLVKNESYTPLNIYSVNPEITRFV